MPHYRPSSQEGRSQAIIVWMPLLLAIALSIGLFAGASLWGDSPSIRWSRSDDNNEDPGRRLNEILRFLEFKYVNAIDLDSLSTVSFQRILKDLDPYSAYIPAESLSELQEQSEGHYYGIGLEFQLINDTVTITGLLDQDAPAQRAGLQPGDQILEVDDIPVSGMHKHLDSLIIILRGELNDPVADLEIRKWMDNSVVELAVPRTDIKVRSVSASYIVKAKTAYIKIERFSNTTYREFMEALEMLSSKVTPPLNVVIDLRGNPGGYLDEAVKITSQFFREKDRLIVRTNGAHSDEKEYKTTGKVFFDIDKLAILIDRNTASGAEILAAAIQDWDRGIVVGEASFGKGLVQEQFLLPNGDALRLTTAKYFTPTGRSIQRTIPNISSNIGVKTDQMDKSIYQEESDSGYVLTRLKKRKVYGGSGVQPDIFIPFYRDSVLADSSAPILYMKKAIGIYRELYVDAPKEMDLNWLRDQLRKGGSGPDQLSELIRGNNPEDSDRKDGYFSEIVYAEVAGLIWGKDAKQQFLNQTDPVFDEALKFIDNKTVEDLPQPAY